MPGRRNGRMTSRQVRSGFMPMPGGLAWAIGSKAEHRRTDAQMHALAGRGDPRSREIRTAVWQDRFRPVIQATSLRPALSGDLGPLRLVRTNRTRSEKLVQCRPARRLKVVWIPAQPRKLILSEFICFGKRLAEIDCWVLGDHSPFDCFGGYSSTL